MVKEFQANNDVKQIRKLITILTDEFAVSHNPHSRKGGLIGLAATAIALGKVRCFASWLGFNSFFFTQISSFLFIISAKFLKI